MSLSLLWIHVCHGRPRMFHPCRCIQCCVYSCEYMKHLCAMVAVFRHFHPYIVSFPTIIYFNAIAVGKPRLCSLFVWLCYCFISCSSVPAFYMGKHRYRMTVCVNVASHSPCAECHSLMQNTFECYFDIHTPPSPFCTCPFFRSVCRITTRNE